MKAVIISIICRCLAYVAILAFVFGVVYLTKNTKYLWLLLLIVTADYVPTYDLVGVNDTNDKAKKDENVCENPFDI